MQLESVILQAEAYDVALDITFGKSELALLNITRQKLEAIGLLGQRFLTIHAVHLMIFVVGQIFCLRHAGGDYGVLSFGTVKVFDSVKQTIQLKNKGKYPTGYQ